MNRFIKTYALAKAAYQTTLEMIEQELQTMLEYTEAQKKLTLELRRSDRDAFDRLNTYVLELRASVEVKNNRFDLYKCLDDAEKLLIEVYGQFIQGKTNAPPLALELFTQPTIDRVLAYPKWRQELIEIILKTPDF